MKVVILCGGRGTRLGSHADSIPKPLIEIGGFPILWHIMKIYAAQGFEDFVLCLGFKGTAIKEYFMGYAAWKYHDFSLDWSKSSAEVRVVNAAAQRWRITFADTGEETNTGGRVKRVVPFLGTDETFMVTYGDGLSNVDLKALLAFHERHAKLATITVVNHASQFGLLEVDPDGRVSRFEEKPPVQQWINGGFFVFDRRVLDYLGTNDILERAPLERLVKDEQPMAAAGRVRS